MNKRTWLNLLLVVVLLGLGALIYFEPGKQTESPSRQLLSGLGSEQIQRIQITQANKPDIVIIKEFSKGSDGWQIIEPLQAPANPGRINKLLAMVSATTQAQYDANSVDHKQLGLSEPDLTITLNDQVFRFGQTEALQGRRYVLHHDKVSLITDRYSYLARGKATDFIDTQLLASNTMLTELQLPGLHLRKANDTWRILDQQDQPSADRIQQLLDAWQHARALEISLIDAAQPAPQQTLRLQTNHGAMEIGLLTTAEEIIFVRQDMGLRYHFTQEQGNKLLHLPESTSTEEATDNTPTGN